MNKKKELPGWVVVAVLALVAIGAAAISYWSRLPTDRAGPFSTVLAASIAVLAAFVALSGVALQVNTQRKENKKSRKADLASAREERTIEIKRDVYLNLATDVLNIIDTMLGYLDMKKDFNEIAKELLKHRANLIKAMIVGDKEVVHRVTVAMEAFARFNFFCIKSRMQIKQIDDRRASLQKPNTDITQAIEALEKNPNNIPADILQRRLEELRLEQRRTFQAFLPAATAFTEAYTRFHTGFMQQMYEVQKAFFDIFAPAREELMLNIDGQWLVDSISASFDRTFRRGQEVIAEIRVGIETGNWGN